MPDGRPFPPSPRRRALARRAGLTAASPLVVGAAAWIGAIVVLVGSARAVATTVGAWIRAACDAPVAGATGALVGAAQDASVLTPASVARAVLELALPLVGIAATGALLVHLAQTRAFWLPRRRVDGAPALPAGIGPRTAHTSVDLAGTAVVGAVALGWLWFTAPRLARMFELTPAELLVAGGAAIGSLLTALAITYVALATIDALRRRAELEGALAMTPTEKREDDRLAAADPRWKAQHALLARGPSAAEAVAGAAIVLLGDDLAIAIAWDPSRQPLPTRTRTGRRAAATQLVGLARRHAVPVHRDAELARLLGDAEGPVPEAAWPRLAEILAAVRGRTR